jgi:hypothetical protein
VKIAPNLPRKIKKGAHPLREETQPAYGEFNEGVSRGRFQQVFAVSCFLLRCKRLF